MKKLMLSMLLLVLSLSVSACDFSNPDATYYGVAYMMGISEGDSGTHDTTFQLVVLIPGLGEMFIPQSDNTSAFLNGVHTEDYEIKAGDLLEIHYNKASNVEILESYPGQFGKEPDKITVYQENVSLTNTGADSYLFTIPIEKIITDHTYEIADLEQGDNLYLWRSTIVSKEPTEEYLCEILIYEIDDNYLGMIVDNNLIKLVLEAYFYDELIYASLGEEE